MKLEKIKLSGFKSFVDPTVIPIHGNLTAIVGPNGCGKSNIIDAVRWVMGESSAKHLRGGSMADVIFNGSSGRKPVSTASVELVFNNSSSTFGGEYAHYDTLAIKRQVSRDGQSLFMLNGSRCRRKDITDLFLGTGLGSRSYAIIEQGTISRMVEAKPDELRVFIEEAAGVSKYKERRSETEMRMRNTRENLERLDDVREEVERQLKSLQKQAEKAEKYTALKQQERHYKVELLVMRWQAYQHTTHILETQLHAAADEHNRVFLAVHDAEKNNEQALVAYKAAQIHLNALQGQYYAVAADVTSLEQAIKHNESNYQEAASQLAGTQQQQAQLAAELASELASVELINADFLAAEAALAVALTAQEQAVTELQLSQQQRTAWQQNWDAYRTETARYNEQQEVQRVKTVQLENQTRLLQIRMDKLQAERDALSTEQLHSDIAALDEGIEFLETQREGLQQRLEALHTQSASHRHRIKHDHDSLHQHRAALHTINGQLTALSLLQQHAMGKDNHALQTWLTGAGLTHNPRLAELLDVESPWEMAVEVVLHQYLEAVCIDDLRQVSDTIEQLVEHSLVLLMPATTRPATVLTEAGGLSLADKVRAPEPVRQWLAKVRCAESVSSAWQVLAQLTAEESVITPDGTWLNAHWLKISRAKDHKTGVLQREKQVRELKEQHEVVLMQIDGLTEAIDDAESALKIAEAEREQVQQQYNRLGSELAQKTTQFSVQSAKMEQQQRRWEQISAELEEIVEELTEHNDTLARARWLVIEASEKLAEQQQQKVYLEVQQEQMQLSVQQAELAVENCRQQVNQGHAACANLHALEHATSKQISRLRTQVSHAEEQLSLLQLRMQQSMAPLAEEKMALIAVVQQKSEVETLLKTQREQQQLSEQQLAEQQEEQVRLQRELISRKDALDALRFEWQEAKVRQQTINEQLKEINAEPDSVLSTLPKNAEDAVWKKNIEQLTEQIERLGAINLTAIDDYQAQSERMKFLNDQHADLLLALATLDQAITKIDKESRLRFKETFDKINSGLQEKFPKLFGGGQAYLTLTQDEKTSNMHTVAGQQVLGAGQDSQEQSCAEPGVTIIARPPGKKNSSIHLLSGGEKALTAVALVFSIFELNPAPFCLLDEVDAPLDDANVERFSKMVEEMSATVQFLYISHNKVTMEIAKQLAGVTMKEPGVSRMVAVDIEEAVSLAEI